MHYAVRGVSPKITLLKFLPRNRAWRLVQKSIDLDLNRSAISMGTMALFNDGLIEPEEPDGISRYLQHGVPVKLRLTATGVVEIERLDRQNLL
jgi:hypothetical protein